MISLNQNFPVISRNLRKEFANSLAEFLVTHNVDGVDIDWEYPRTADTEYFTLLLQEMKEALTPYRKILAIAANPCLFLDQYGYDVPAIMEIVDFTVLMLYEMHGGAWQNYTANHGNYWHATSRYNMVTCVNSWLERGAIHNKLVIGIPTYGRNFQLDDPNVNGVGSLATFKDFGKPGEMPASYSYNIICKNIQVNGWTRYYENVKSTGPYVVYGKIWSGYDDIESIEQKATEVIKLDYHGIAVWSLDHDDYSNSCGGGFFPLITSAWKINSHLKAKKFGGQKITTQIGK